MAGAERAARSTIRDGHDRCALAPGWATFAESDPFEFSFQIALQDSHATTRPRRLPEYFQLAVAGLSFLGDAKTEGPIRLERRPQRP